MTLRYGAIVGSLRSLRGAPTGVVFDPSECVRYRATTARGIAPLADVYLPARPTGASVVLVHGGGFVIGSRRMKPMRLLASRLVEAGVAAVAIDYRMIFRGGRLAEAVEDVVDAFAHWRARAATLDLDPDAISLAGLSAGGSLALLAAARCAPHRLVLGFGLYEIDHLRGVASILPRLLFGTTDRDAWRSRSPGHAPQPPAPTLLLHGDADGLVPVDQARRLAARRTALGLPTSLIVYPDAPHGFFNHACTAATAGAHALVTHVSGR